MRTCFPPRRVIAYNRNRSPNSYDSAIDGAVPEMLGAESAGESLLQLLWTNYRYAISDAHDGGPSGRNSKSAS